MERNHPSVWVPVCVYAAGCTLLFKLLYDVTNGVGRTNGGSVGRTNGGSVGRTNGVSVGRTNGVGRTNVCTKCHRPDYRRSINCRRPICSCGQKWGCNPGCAQCRWGRGPCECGHLGCFWEICENIRPCEGCFCCQPYIYD